MNSPLKRSLTSRGVGRVLTGPSVAILIATPSRLVQGKCQRHARIRTNVDGYNNIAYVGAADGGGIVFEINLLSPRL